MIETTIKEYSELRDLCKKYGLSVLRRNESRVEGKGRIFCSGINVYHTGVDCHGIYYIVFPTPDDILAYYLTVIARQF